MLRALPILLAAFLLSGCSLLGEPCMPACGKTRSSTTPLVAFLYPDGKVPMPEETPVLPVPMRVGLAFVPGYAGDVPPARRQQILEQIRAGFVDRRYVESIVIIPEMYLNADNGFTGLEQIARLQSLDVLALVSLDQVSHRDDNDASITYLTIVGAFLVKGNDHETHTLLDLAVVDPHSRTLVLRAAGTSSLSGHSTWIEQDKEVREQAAVGLDRANARLIAQFGIELDGFEKKVKAGTAPVKVAKRKDLETLFGSGGGGGAFEPWALAPFVVLLLLRLFPRRRGARASRGKSRPASAPS